MSELTQKRSAHDVIRAIVADGKSVEVEVSVSRGGPFGTGFHVDCYLRLDDIPKRINLEQATDLIQFLREGEW